MQPLANDDETDLQMRELRVLTTLLLDAACHQRWHELATLRAIRARALRRLAAGHRPAALAA